jgi:hypothetical protein
MDDDEPTFLTFLEEASSDVNLGLMRVETATAIEGGKQPKTHHLKTLVEGDKCDNAKHKLDGHACSPFLPSE